jgi:hypothetical protein
MRSVARVKWRSGRAVGIATLAEDGTAAYKPPNPLTARGRARALGRIDVRCPHTNEVIRNFNDFIQLDETRREENQAFDS